MPCEVSGEGKEEGGYWFSFDAIILELRIVWCHRGREKVTVLSRPRDRFYAVFNRIFGVSNAATLRLSSPDCVIFSTDSFLVDLKINFSMCGFFRSVLWHPIYILIRLIRLPGRYLRGHESSPRIVDRRDYIALKIGSESPSQDPLQTGSVNENEMRKLQSEVTELQRLLNSKTTENAHLKRVVELGNSQEYNGGESFLETEATPHLLHKAVDRVNTTSGILTKFLMQALKNSGVNCSSVAKALVPSVVFERDGHTKFVYQALVCDVLFDQFENDSFHIEDNAPDTLDSETRMKDNFERYKQLNDLENPEELVYDDAADNDFRRFCNKKQIDLIAALSRTGAPGVENVGVLVFGKVFGPDGIRRQELATSVTEVKSASSFIKLALSVFLVHKLAFALRPTAEIFRPTRKMKFNRNYMESILMSTEESDDDEGDNSPIVFGVGFTIVPGFKVNRIVVHSKVYKVRRA